MGTNYYIRKIPFKKEEYSEELNEIHIGKRSAGWKFLWNPNIYLLTKHELKNRNNNYFKYFVVKECLSIDSKFSKYVIKYYDLNKQSIENFLKQKDFEIYNEYDEKIDVSSFLKMAYSWCQENGYDNKSYQKYEEKIYNKIVSEKTNNLSEYKIRKFHSPPILYYSTERDQFWEDLGYNPTGYGDFYSDGLRFSTSCNFS